MAIDFKNVKGNNYNPKGIDFKDVASRLVIAPPPAPVKAPEPMPSPVDNSKNLYNNRGFQSFETPTASPVAALQQKSRRNPFDDFDMGTPAGRTANSTLAVADATTPNIGINEILGVPFGILGGAIGGAVGAVGSSATQQIQGKNPTDKDYWKTIGSESIAYAKDMYKKGSELGAAGTKLGAATAVAPALVGAYFTAASGIGIYKAVKNTIDYSKQLKESGDSDSRVKSIDQYLKNGSAEGYRMIGMDDETIKALEGNSFFNALGNVILYGGAYMATKGTVSEAKPKVSRLSDFITKDKITEYKLPETVKISPEEVYDIYSGKAGYEKNLSTQEKGELLATLNLTSKEIGDARKSGIFIEKPTEVVIKLADKPWFAKIKKAFNIEPVERVISTETIGTPKQGVSGLIEGPTGKVTTPTKGLDFTNEIKKIESVKPTEVIPKLEFGTKTITPADVTAPVSIDFNAPAATQYEMAAPISRVETPVVEKQVLYNGSNKVVTEVPNDFVNVKVIEKSQKELLQELAAQGNEKATAILENPKNFYINADRLIRESLKGDYDAIKYNNVDRPAIGAEYHDLETGKFYAEKRETAEAYSLQSRGAKYEMEGTSKVEQPKTTGATKIIADKGEYKQAPQTKGQTSFRVMETPEQYRLAKSIAPDLKFIMKTSSKFNGYFRAKGIEGEEIAMNRKLYKKREGESQSEYQTRIGKTMAHEIGHLIDYLPDQVSSRGNLIGHLQSLSNFKQNFVAKPELLKKRQELMRKINEINKNDELLTPLQEMMTKPLFEELSALDKQITFSNPVFKEELVKLSKEWKPWEEGLNENYDNYRKSASELYADFNSVLFNDPALAQEIAPRFYNEFFNFIGKKPEVERNFLAIQGELMGDRATLMSKRYQMLKDSGKNAQGKFASMVAEQQAIKKKPWLQSVIRDGWYQHYWSGKKGKPVQNLMEKLDRGFNNEQVVWTENNIGPIMDKLKKSGLDSNDMDAVLKLERMAKDTTREDVANLKGLDVKTSQDVLSELSNILGEEKAKVLVSAAKDLRLALKDLQLKYSDLWTPEQKELMESNDFYAPFNILFKESNNINYYIKQSKGNIDKDFNSFVNTLLRAKTVTHFGEKNFIKKSVIDSFLENGDKDIQKAKVSYQKLANGQLQRTVANPPRGYETVEIKRDGKVESYYMPDDIAHSLNQDNIGTLHSIMKPFNIAAKPFKFLYTGYINPGFQFVNFFFRDWGTARTIFGPEWGRSAQGLSNKGFEMLANNTYRNLYSKFRQANYYSKAFKLSKDKNIYNRFSPMVEEALKSHVIEVDPSGMYKIDTKDINEQEEAGIKYILQATGLVDKSSGIKQVGEVIKGFTQSLEETPKLASYMYMEDLGVLNEDNLSVIRNYVGSPNFWKQGRENKNISSALMFYNPIIRGVQNIGKKAFIKDAAGKGSRSAFWWRVTRAAIIPAMMGVAAEEGLFGDDIKRMYGLLPEYLKGSYLNIPVGINEDGKVKSISVPMDEDARMVHSLTRNMMRMALHSDDKSIRKRALIDILAYTGGQVPGSNPAINIAGQWSIAMKGGNPFDSFRNQQIFLANEEKLPKFEKAKIMTKWTLNQSGLMKLNIHDSVNSQTVEEKVIQFLPIVNRFVRITNRGEYEADQAIIKQETERAAIELANKKGVVNDIIEKVHKDPKYNISNDVLTLAKERLGDDASDTKKLVTEYKTLTSAVQEGYTTSFGNVHYRSLMNVNNDTKEKVLLNIWEKESMNKKEYTNFVVTAASLKIISTAVAVQVLNKTTMVK